MMETGILLHVLGLNYQPQVPNSFLLVLPNKLVVVHSDLIQLSSSLVSVGTTGLTQPPEAVHMCSM